MDRSAFEISCQPGTARPPNTNPMWEGACPRWRWLSQYLSQPCHRHRSLAKARHLPQGIGVACEISSSTLPARRTRTHCGRGLAPDSNGSVNPCTSHATAIEASLKLDISHSGSGLPARSPAQHYPPAEHKPNVGGAVRRFDLPPIAMAQSTPAPAMPPPSKPR
jgi:hypothetical protein